MKIQLNTPRSVLNLSEVSMATIVSLHLYKFEIVDYLTCVFCSASISLAATDTTRGKKTDTKIILQVHKSVSESQLLWFRWQLDTKTQKRTKFPCVQRVGCAVRYAAGADDVMFLSGVAPQSERQQEGHLHGHQCQKSESHPKCPFGALDQ
eukprot:2619518-Amphidinium_carterae.2